MAEDQTQVIRRIDELQERIDKVFKRVNPNPVYTSKSAIADAISDNLRYLGDDRKFELGEIFFGILEQIYERIVKQDMQDPFCNPQVSADAGERVPEPEMLMRDMMPLAWALNTEWTPPELKNVYCVFFQSFTEEEAQLFYELITFLAETFPEFAQRKEYSDFIGFWDNLAHNREVLIPEDDEAKSKLLTVLAGKQAASLEKRLNSKKQ